MILQYSAVKVHIMNRLYLGKEYDVMLKILLTGITGMLGQALENVWKNKFLLFGTASRQQNRNGICSNVPFLPFNLESDDYSQLKNFCDPDIIINCAAITDLSLCEKDDVYAYKINSYAVQKIALTFPSAYIIQISTDAVFGRNTIFPDEMADPEPFSIYGKSKLEGEKLLLLNSQSSVVLRTTIVGTGGHRFGMSLAEWILNDLNSGKNINLYSDALFTPISIWDFAEILEWCIDKRPRGILHAAGSERISKYDFGFALACIAKLNSDLILPALLANSSNAAVRRFDQSLSSGKLEKLRGVPLPGGLSCVTSIANHRSLK